jgi:hypothetical protein
MPRCDLQPSPSFAIAFAPAWHFNSIQSQRVRIGRATFTFFQTMPWGSIGGRRPRVSTPFAIGRRELRAPPPAHPLCRCGGARPPPSLTVTSKRAACADGSLTRRYRHSLKAPPRGKRELGLAVSRRVASELNHW